MLYQECVDTYEVNRKGKREEGGNELSTLELVRYKYEPGCVPVSSDHSPDTMRLLALLLMIGAAGKHKEKDTRTRYTCTHT